MFAPLAWHTVRPPNKNWQDASPGGFCRATGTGNTVSGSNGGEYSSTAYPVDLGTIAGSDGVVEKDIGISGVLEVSKKRILSKGFDVEMVLNFSS